MAFLGLIWRGARYQVSIGMWTIFFNILPVVLNEPFQERGVFFFGVKLPPAFYPFALCAIFQLFGLNFDIFVAACVAHICFHFLLATLAAQYKIKHLHLSLNQLKRLEKNKVIVFFRSKTNGFKVADVAEYHGLPVLVFLKNTKREKNLCFIIITK